MNPGKLEKIQFRVAKLRDGRSYITRRVDAWQEDRFIFTASMSFQIPEPKQPQYYAPPPVISASGHFKLMHNVPDGHSNIPKHVLLPEMCPPGTSRVEWGLKNLPKDHAMYPLLVKAHNDQQWLPLEFRPAVPTMYTKTGVIQFGTTIAYWMRSKGPCEGSDNYQRATLGFHIEYVAALTQPIPSG